MKLEEKIIQLRKSKNWSQEELAYQLDVSRQAVSKWESGHSIPDINKIVMLAELFSVSTDYLLKDNDSNQFVNTEINTKAINKDEIKEYLNSIDKYSKRIAFGVLLCIFSPVTLISLFGIYNLDNSLINETLVYIIGLVTLFLFIIVAVINFIIIGFNMDKYKYIETDKLLIKEDIKNEIILMRDKYQSKINIGVVIGISIILISPVPLIVSGIVDKTEKYPILFVPVLITLIAIAVFILIIALSKKGAFDRLLQEGPYSVKNKEKNKELEKVSTIYWCVLIAIYLTVSFLTRKWNMTWIIMLAGSIVYGAVEALFSKKK